MCTSAQTLPGMNQGATRPVYTFALCPIYTEGVDGAPCQGSWKSRRIGGRAQEARESPKPEL